MSCLFDIPPEIQQEGLDMVRGDRHAMAEVGAFLLALQDNPLPAARQPLSPDDAASFWCQLNCGVYISWKIEASPEDLLNLSFGHVSPAIVIKVLGFGRGAPPGR
ncbi:MAG: hypothetical protein P4K78_05690 [Terracidiphilus sp.]|nr:hypothetical protein [Terracidiphilus sp.]